VDRSDPATSRPAGVTGVRGLLDRRPVRFAVVGVWNTVFGVGAFWLLDVVAGDTIGYVAVLTVSTAMAIAQAHQTQRHLVWHSHRPYLAELARFSSVYLVTYVLNLVALVVAVEVLHAPKVPAQAVIALALAVGTFTVHRLWTFAHPAPAVTVDVDSRTSIER
jgi:putative flippase GtrA